MAAVARRDAVDLLREQLATAIDAASDAYRHTSRLIRVLTVLGQPSTPAELVAETLVVLSQVFSADVAMTVRVVAGRLLLTGSCGIPEGDPAFAAGWPLAGAAAEAVAGGRAIARTGAELDRAADVPPSLAPLAPGSAVWVPVGDEAAGAEELLVLYRRTEAPFDPTELQILGSVASRLRLAVEARRRSESVERLARSGHLLAARLDLPSLYEETARLFPQLVGADGGGVVTVAEDGTAELQALATDPDGPDGAWSGAVWPRPADTLWGWPELSRGEPYRGSHDILGTTGAVLGVPVTRDGRPVALLYAYRHDRRPFLRDATDSATVFANYVAAATTNAELYRALRDSEASLRQQATHDPLTELANRTLTTERLEEALAGPGAGHVGLLFCDLDKFKEVNDRLGHEAGDELLLHVADRLRGCVRQGDLLARFGGDEFVIVLDQVTDLAGVTEIGHRVVRALEAPFGLRGERVDISASVGGVLGVRGQATVSAMLRDADAAMYAAKASGPGRVEVFDDDASHRSLDRLELRSELTRALTGGELYLHYQPIFELATGRIDGFEALARWRHPRRGLIPPDVFIPLAEETGAIIGIGQWVLDQACRQLGEWQRLLGDRPLRISVNLSATQLQQADAAARTLAVIRDAGVSFGDVWLEITEHSSIRTDVTEFATALRAAGVHFALDDFGISYSNLSHLKRLPVEILKIDRSFVAGLTAKDTDRGIVRAVLAIADSLGLSVVAEGIETAEQRDDLLALGCRQGQGYLLSRPVPAEEATALLLAQLPAAPSPAGPLPADPLPADPLPADPLPADPLPADLGHIVVS